MSTVVGSSLDTQRVFVFGDTPHDIAAAHAAHAIAVGVASGRYSESELREAGCDHVFASLLDALPGTGAESP